MGDGRGRVLRPMSGEGEERVPYHVTYPVMHLIFSAPPEQTDTCENTTFPKLRLRAVIIRFYKTCFTIFAALKRLRS